MLRLKKNVMLQWLSFMNHYVPMLLFFQIGANKQRKQFKENKKEFPQLILLRLLIFHLEYNFEMTWQN